jgi:hypothetical protein
VKKEEKDSEKETQSGLVVTNLRLRIYHTSYCGEAVVSGCFG